MDGVHDMGGMHGFGPVRTPGDEVAHHEWWEVRAQVLGLLSGAATRGRLEALGPVRYLGSGYYTRWLLAAEDGVVAKGVLDQGDLERWYARFAADQEAEPPAARAPEDGDAVRAGLQRPNPLPVASASRFLVGDRVRVRRMRPERHHRCPRYVRGVVGEVERVCGVDRLPGARRDDDTTEPVYTVRFASTDLWGGPGGRDEGPFSVSIDLWEQYLEAP